MKDISELEEIRRQNFFALVAELGGQERMACELDISQAYVSKLITGKSPFTEKSARRIEEILSKPTGWLDHLERDALRDELYGLVSEIVQGDDEEVRRIIAVIRAIRQ